MDLIEHCKRNRISLKELSEKTGIIQPNFYKYSRKTANPTIKTILLINAAIKEITGKEDELDWYLPVHNSKRDEKRA